MSFEEPMSGPWPLPVSADLLVWDQPVPIGAFSQRFADLRGEDTLLVMNWMQPGMEPGPHSHPFEQIAVIVQGTVRFHVGDEVYDAGPGSMIRIPPDVIHWGEVIGDEPAMNLDVFNPIREDYKHLVEHQAGDFGEG